ncbi:hypothetical protein WDW37_14315 [Bdellovibrionota bacterium FG-1]
MAQTGSSKKNKSRVSQVLDQARESLKLLETLEKETLAKAKTFVRNPLQAERRKKMANEKILAKFKTMGVATSTEVRALEEKIERLEREFAALQAMVAESQLKRAAKAANKTAPTPPSTETFPNT